ncbi:putative PurR-regulated permease PerM (plasmid) [Beijerinckiaceae bacterium RH AL1]|nr:AI-2E family transporter [Beijerinckiaceae bacterium]VVB50244.1 putative PurR-regulated permease PerM [Beijerinckiaceae bacterium RH CH11]VVB50253.1 putative PurR-regulated permease PerM [Beijerinckiaceae bacterium RH AL8]VVC57301.1 putative PurR-regulated permease PerM [Beijerinckiaceae bacterium RH AL1]
MTLATSVTAVAALSLARDALLPITLALILSFLLAPVVEFLRRLRVPRILAVALAVTFSLGVILSVGGIIGVQIAGMSADIPRYATTVERKVEAVRSLAFDKIAGLAHLFGRSTLKADGFSHVNPGDPQAPKAASAMTAGSDDATDPFVIARRILQPTLNPVAVTLVVFIISIFMLVQREDLRDRIVRLFGAADLRNTTVAMNEAGRLLGRYFLAQFAINASYGGVIAIGLFFVGLPSPALWGVLAALLRFVPYIGPVMGFALPATVAMAVAPDWTMTLWIAGLFAAIEGVTGQVIEPMVYGRSSGLSPTAVVVAAIFWTWIWGPVGLILSTPLTLCVVVIGRYVERFEFLEILLGDRAALTTSQNFYQRILCDHVDEAQEQAEVLLEELSLGIYYDEVALNGLRLAAHDVELGVIAQPQIDRIIDNVRALVLELADHVDANPAPGSQSVGPLGVSQFDEVFIPEFSLTATFDPRWDHGVPIMCVSGNAPLDEAATIMLAQLLNKRGIGAEVVPYENASRQGVDALMRDGVTAICVTCLEIAGNSTHLKYLIRRLRKRFPTVSILVGLWPVETAGRVESVAGADHCATSLMEIVQACLALRALSMKPVLPP